MLTKSMWCAGLVLVSCAVARAQISPDTLLLTTQKAEQIFLSKNLNLLAAHYGVRADSALIRQARLWDNPTLTVDQNVYVKGEGFFRHGTDAVGNPIGQYYVQLQQLIQLGGKRQNAVAMAGANAAISQLKLEDLMLGLRTRLRQDLFNLSKLQSLNALYHEAFLQLQKLEAGTEAQFEAGNVSRKDLVRVQGLLEGIRLQLADNSRQAEELQGELRTLLAVRGDTFFQCSLPESTPKLPDDSFNDLLALAVRHNPTYLIAAKQLDFQKLNYRYQRSLVVPDLEVGPNYDRASNFAPNYFGLTLGIPLPLWNRNQGNIRAANFSISQQQAAMDAQGLSLENDLRTAYKKLSLAVNLADPERHAFYEDYRSLFNKMLESYRTRQVSLVEFIDFFNSYEEIQERHLDQELNLRLSKEALNYIVGVDVAQ